MCVVGPALAVQVDGRVPGIIGRWAISRRFFLRRKLFCYAQASISVPSTVKCSSESSRLRRACSTIIVKNSSATAPSSSRSRFFVNTVGCHTGSFAREADEPAEQQVVLQLLHQHPLAAH